MNPRLLALLDVEPWHGRELAGIHDRYDGRVVDLSPDGVRRLVDGLGDGPEESDPHDEAQIRAAEAAARSSLRELELHRRDVLTHVMNLDVSCYDLDYAPEEERADATRRHLAQWPDAIDASIESLDGVPRDVAHGLLGAVRGLVAGLDEDGHADAFAAHRRLVTHVERAADDGDPDPALGAEALTALMGVPQAMDVDLGRLSEEADAERDRLWELIRAECGRLRPGAAPEELVPELLGDHPDEEADLYAEARRLVDEVGAFTFDHDLLDPFGGQCRVGPAPESRRYAMAFMAPNAPFEADRPSWYWIVPPAPELAPDEREQWLQVFSRTTLPAITVHEVTPGHFAHFMIVRELESDARRCLASWAFVEGWAHYAEELFVEEGFKSDDPRFAIGVYIEALLRVTRLAGAIGIHTGAMTVDELARRFTQDAFLEGPSARHEAERATYDPTYGRYTWGKLVIGRLRDEARRRWGADYSHRRFHRGLLGLGCPPLGLLGDALENA